MPQYLYQCANKHQSNVMHGMTEVPQVICPECGQVMHRRPQAPSVLWSRFIDMSPAVKQHVNNISAKVDANARRYGK